MGSDLDVEEGEVREDFSEKVTCQKWENEGKVARERGGEDWFCVCVCKIGCVCV